MRLYNTLTRTKELFTPIDKKEVKMYVCGITPYDTTHLGHAFTYIVFDVLQRYMQNKGYQINYTQNVTDIDDDILKRARQTNQDWKSLGDFWTKKFVNDLKTLNMIMPTHYVKATETMPTIIEFIEGLENNGYAYQKEGNVYFRTKKDPEYGKLSKYSREQMLLLSKERGANPDDPNKEDPLDFIMWQKSKADEPSWDSKWSKGRPGWHIECSAMVYKYLYKYIDIHGGGRDLIYPHHESEIAQSEQFTGKKPFVRYWLHTGAVMYEGEKMSKSLGNLVMVSDLLKTYSPDTLRYMLLSHHYRTPWEFHESELEEAKNKVDLLRKTIKLTGKENPEIIKAFEKAMDDDLDTPKALDELLEAIKVEDGKTVKHLSSILGFTFAEETS